MSKLCPVIVFFLGCSLSGLQAKERLSSKPFTYVIDYGDQWITKEGAAQSFGNCPPDLLHIGKAVPITHHWGPIPCMRGENQQTGGPGHTLRLESIRLLSPEELQEKIEKITRAVRRLHDAGIPCVMPYICNYTLAGDHEKRLGFWAFYDQWETYGRWLGPKPETDPTDWIHKTAEGRRIDPAYGFTPPYYAPLHRYGACSNNPSWNEFSRAIVKLIAQCGYDGVFVDNSNKGPDGCSYCEKSFAEWTKKQPASASPEVLRQRWRMAVVRDRLDMLKEAGAQVNPSFQVFPNVGDYQKVLVYGEACDYFMFESVKSPGCLVSGGPPESEDILVNVAADAAVKTSTATYAVRHADTYAEVTAEISFPLSCPPHAPVAVSARVLTVGDSDRDNDCLERLVLRFTHLDSEKMDDVEMGPAPGVGDPEQVRGAKRPPVLLTGTWKPSSTGGYDITVCYRYTDAQHLSEADHTPVSDPLRLPYPYRVSLGGLSCAFHAGTKTVGLDYQHTKPGWESVQELGLAEGAAAGGRHAVSAGGEPLKKYSRFFRAVGEKAAGLAPWADVILLYAHWGGNPGTVGRDNGQTVQEYLSQGHVLYRGRVDRDLRRQDLKGRKGPHLILVCRDYDLTDEQIELLRAFLEAGGSVYSVHDDVRIHFRPIREILGGAANALKPWRWSDPPCFKSICPSRGRLRGIRFTAFSEPGTDSKRLVLHVVNYNVCLVEEGFGQVTSIPDLSVRVAVPKDWQKAKAKVHDPDRSKSMDIPCQIQEGRAHLTLPKLKIYEMTEIIKTQ